MNCGNKLSLNITDEITIEAWVKADTAQGVSTKYPVIKGGNTYILSYDHGVAPTWRGNLALYDGSNWQVPGAGVTISHNVWHHFVGVYDPPHGIIYLDGVEKIKENIGSFPINTSASNLHLGGASSSFFNGTIDEVRIYDTALEASQIKARYVEGLDKLHAEGKLDGKEYYQKLTETGF